MGETSQESINSCNKERDELAARIDDLVKSYREYRDKFLAYLRKDSDLKYCRKYCRKKALLSDQLFDLGRKYYELGDSNNAVVCWFDSLQLTRNYKAAVIFGLEDRGNYSGWLPVGDSEVKFPSAESVEDDLKLFTLGLQCLSTDTNAFLCGSLLAIPYFSNLIKRYPQSVWVKKADMMMAFCSTKNERKKYFEKHTGKDVEPLITYEKKRMYLMDPASDSLDLIDQDTVHLAISAFPSCCVRIPSCCVRTRQLVHYGEDHVFNFNLIFRNFKTQKQLNFSVIA